MPGPILDLDMFTFKPDTLYSQTVLTDFRVGEIIINTPINSFGNLDPMRPALFFGRCKLNVNGQHVPVQFQLEATDIQEAMQDFPIKIKAAVEQLYSQQLQHAILEPQRNTKLDLSKLKS